MLMCLKLNSIQVKFLQKLHATRQEKPYIKTLGGQGTDTLRFVTSLGKRITQATGDDRATLFLRQRLGIAVQRGTAACVRETLVVEVDDPIGADFRR